MITGENLTQWRRLVWKFRRDLYVTEYNDKIRRENEKLELRRLQNG